MNVFPQTFKAECLKWRRNWASVIVLLIPFTQTAFLFVLFWFSEDRVNRMGPGFLAWYEVNYSAWTTLFLPVLSALVPWIMWDLEGSSRIWKHLFLQPIPRYAHYTTKVAGHAFLLILSQLLLAGLLFQGGLILRANVPVLAMGPVHPELLLRLVGTTLIASLPLIAFHTWFSSRFSSLSAALVVALGGFWCTVPFVGRSFIHLSPWGAMTLSIGIVSKGPAALPKFILETLTCTVILVVLGILDFARREEPCP